MLFLKSVKESALATTGKINLVTRGKCKRSFPFHNQCEMSGWFSKNPWGKKKTKLDSDKTTESILLNCKQVGFSN